jgi:hypothetical protein
MTPRGANSPTSFSVSSSPGDPSGSHGLPRLRTAPFNPLPRYSCRTASSSIEIRRSLPTKTARASSNGEKCDGNPLVARDTDIRLQWWGREVVTIINRHIELTAGAGI